MNELNYCEIRNHIKKTTTDGGGGIFVRYILVIALYLCRSTPPTEEATLLWLSIKVID